MERLARHLPAVGRSASVKSDFDAHEWGSAMASGSAGRLIARARTLLLFPIGATVAAIRDAQTVLVPTTNPFVLPAVMTALRPLHGRPVVPLVYDLFPDAFEATGSASDSIVSRVIRRVNRWWLHSADGVVFIGPNMARAVNERYGEPRRWTIIETGADTQELSDDADLVDVTELDRWASGRIVCSYVGNMGLMHDIDAVAAAAPLLAEAGSEIGLLLAASGPGPEALRSRWQGQAVNVRFEEPLADDAWRRLLRRSDIALVTLKAEAAHTSLPSKTFSAMAAGSAIIAVAPSNSDLAEAIVETGAGLVVEPGDGDALARALLRLEEDPALLSQLRERALAAASDRYDLSALAVRWDNFLTLVEDDIS